MLRDHKYGASASHGVPVYAPALPVPSYKLLGENSTTTRATYHQQMLQ